MATDKHERISINPAVMVGKTVIKGTRITVESLMKKVKAGWSIERILEAYPHLTAADIQAALDYAEDKRL